MSGAREQFGSRIGFILAAAGSAVGIGNLVGFPVGAAKNGGGAFLLMYAIFVFAILRQIYANGNNDENTSQAVIHSLQSRSIILNRK